MAIYCNVDVIEKDRNW